MNKPSAIALLLGTTIAFSAMAKRPVDTSMLKPRAFTAVVATADPTPRMTLPSKVWSLSPASVLGIVAFIDSKNRAEKARAEFGIADPAQFIASSLGRELGEDLGVPMVDRPDGSDNGPTTGNYFLRSPKTLAATYGTDTLILNVGTINWFADDYGKDRYRVSYAVQAQLVDAGTKSILAKISCIAPLKTKDNAPYLSAMLADQAQSLKSELQEAADYCVGVLRKGLFFRTQASEHPALPGE